MATCNNCGHTQSDFLSSADIESIQFNSILVQDKCQKMENENASLRSMLKTESDQHQARVQELLNKFEAELGRLKEKNDAEEAEKLRGENEILKSSVYELNLKVNGTDDLIKDLKAQLVHALEDADRLKEVLKNNCDYIRGLETQLLEAIDRADHLEEAALARDEDDASAELSYAPETDDETVQRPKMSLDMQLEESLVSSLERIKNIFNASNGTSEASAKASSVEDSSNASRESVSSEASTASKESSASEMSTASKESAISQSSDASSDSSFHSSSSGESSGSTGSSVESSSSSKMSSGSSTSTLLYRPVPWYQTKKEKTAAEIVNAEPDNKDDEELSDGFVDLVF